VGRCINFRYKAIHLDQVNEAVFDGNLKRRKHSYSNSLREKAAQSAAFFVR